MGWKSAKSGLSAGVHYTSALSHRLETQPQLSHGSGVWRKFNTGAHDPRSGRAQNSFHGVAKAGAFAASGSGKRYPRLDQGTFRCVGDESAIDESAINKSDS
jgi:hypothetical protein